MGDVHNDSYDLQLYFNNGILCIANVKNCDESVLNHFTDNLHFLGQGRREKDKTLAIIKAKNNLAKSLYNQLSVQNVYDTFMCPYGPKTTKTNYWVVNGYDSERIKYDFEHNCFIMYFQYEEQDKGKVTKHLNKAQKIKPGDQVLLFKDNHFYGHATFTAPDLDHTKELTLRGQVNNRSRNEEGDLVVSTDASCFYEDLNISNCFDGGWGQRISVEEWLDWNETGIEVKGISKELESGIITDTIIPLKDNTFFDLVRGKLSGEIDNIKEYQMTKNYAQLLQKKKQIILQGPPGTGKTYLAKKIAEQIIFGNQSISSKDRGVLLGSSDRFKLFQFHPSYSYEDFVRGITAKTVGENISYVTENKVLATFAKEASSDNGLDTKNYVLIIDEINRANLPSVLGELIYALEYRGEPVESMYAIGEDSSITLPDNLLIIGTMNTADRSVGHIDYAIKRRFSFVDVLPYDSPIELAKAKELFKLVSQLFVEEEDGKLVDSKYLAPDFNYKDVQLGHSYFIVDNDEELKMNLEYDILPILNEYIKDGLLLDSAKGYITENITKFV